MKIIERELIKPWQAEQKNESEKPTDISSNKKLNEEDISKTEQNDPQKELKTLDDIIIDKEDKKLDEKDKNILEQNEPQKELKTLADIITDKKSETINVSDLSKP